MFDVAIVGGGPAGATLARLLGRQRRVLLIDRRPLDRPPTPGGRGKCCGGLLAPDAQRMLAELGLGLPPHVLAGPQLFAVRSIDLPARIERFYQRHYINLDRERFDRWLLSLAPANVEVRAGVRFAGFEQDGDGVTVRMLTADGMTLSERADVLVGADGAGSAVRAALGRNGRGGRPPRRYLAVQQWLADGESSPWFGAFFDPRITDFYGWTIPKGELLVVGAAVRPGADAWERLDRLKASLADWGLAAGRCVRRESALLNRPTGRGDILLGAGRVALVGEAAGWISPSSAEGFSYAFASARALAGALAARPADWLRHYRRATLGLRRNVACKRLKARAIYTAPVRRAIMRAGLASLGRPAGA